MTELIHKPLPERSEPKEGDFDGLGFTNYLAFVIANRWIEKLNFIINEQWCGDIPPSFVAEDDMPSPMLFGSYNLTIQLKKYTEDQKHDLSHKYKCKPIGYEPELPFNIIPYNEFKLNNPCDFVFLSKSPGYTSKETDVFIDIISEYIELY